MSLDVACAGCGEWMGLRDLEFHLRCELRLFAYHCCACNVNFASLPEARLHFQDRFLEHEVVDERDAQGTYLVERRDVTLEAHLNALYDKSLAEAAARKAAEAKVARMREERARELREARAAAAAEAAALRERPPAASSVEELIDLIQAEEATTSVPILPDLAHHATSAIEVDDSDCGSVDFDEADVEAAVGNLVDEVVFLEEEEAGIRRSRRKSRAPARLTLIEAVAGTSGLHSSPHKFRSARHPTGRKRGRPAKLGLGYSEVATETEELQNPPVGGGLTPGRPHRQPRGVGAGTGVAMAPQPPQEGDGRWECRLCHKRFAKHCFLLHAFRGHTATQPYACVYCPYKTKELRYLRKHQASKHQITMAADTYINSYAEIKGEIRAKMTECFGDYEKLAHRRLACKACGVEVGRRYLSVHAAQAHLKEAIYSCRLCPFTSLSWWQDQVQCHVRKAHGQDPKDGLNYVSHVPVLQPLLTKMVADLFVL